MINSCSECRFKDDPKTHPICEKCNLKWTKIEKKNEKRKSGEARTL